MIPKSLLLLAALVGAPLAGQDAWGNYVKSQVARAYTADRWVLALSGKAMTSPQGLALELDDTFLRLVASGEFALDYIPDEAAQALWEARGWKIGDAHWVMVSPTGEVVGEGAGYPSAEATLDLLRRSGLLPKWERRTAFLKEHPDQGEARWDALEEALAWAGQRIAPLQAQGILRRPSGNLIGLGREQVSFATPTEPSGIVLAERVLRDVADTLEPILDLPQWQDGSWLVYLGFTVRGWDTSQYPRLHTLLGRLYEGLQTRLEAFPDRSALWISVALFGPALSRDPLEAMTRVHPKPGEAWPNPMYLRLVMEGLSRRQDWPAFLAFLEGLPEPKPEPGPTAERWKAFCNRRGLVHLLRCQALLRLERWEEAQGALAEARKWSGSQWKSQTVILRQALNPIAPDRKAAFEHLAAQPELPDPEPLPALPIPKLVLAGKPAWAPQWDLLKRSEPLQAWAASELRWERSTPALEQKLQQQEGWDAPPNWRLLLGDMVVAEGSTCPTAQALADQLERVSPSRQHRLAQALQKAPRNLTLRRELAEAVLAGKPRDPLESQAAADARLSRAPLRFPEGWQPTPEIWQWNAQKILPELEQELKSWPSRAEAWRAWIQWAEQHPSQPSALALVKSIPIWGNETRWSAWLPKEVHLAVAEELRRSGRFEEMRAWFQEAWDGVGGRPLAFGNPLGFNGMGRTARIKDLGESIVNPLREALTALRRDREVVALHEAFESLKGNEFPGGRRRGQP